MWEICDNMQKTKKFHNNTNKSTNVISCEKTLNLIFMISCFLKAECLKCDMIWKIKYHRIKLRHNFKKSVDNLL